MLSAQLPRLSTFLLLFFLENKKNIRRNIFRVPNYLEFGSFGPKCAKDLMHFLIFFFFTGSKVRKQTLASPCEQVLRGRMWFPINESYYPIHTPEKCIYKSCAYKQLTTESKGASRNDAPFGSMRLIKYVCVRESTCEKVPLCLYKLFL